MASPRQPRSASLRYLHKKFVGDDPERLESLEAERVNADIAQKIYDMRTAANLTQTELAKLAHTTASVICRLEDAEYEGHSLSMLRRIATALHKRVKVSFVPLEETVK